MNHYSILFLLMLLVEAGPAFSQDDGQDVPCGPSIVTIGDAWEFIVAERSRMETFLPEGDLNEWPQRIAAISAHAKFIQTKAYFLFGENRTKLEGCVQTIRDARFATTTLALSGKRDALVTSWRGVEEKLDTVAALLPAGSLVPTSQLVHILPPVRPTTMLRLISNNGLSQGTAVTVRFGAEQNQVQGSVGLLEEHLAELHGARMHAFVVNEALTDYHHLHPKPSGTAGEYELSFTPATSGPYRCWINLVPLNSGREEFPFVDFQKLERQLVVLPEAKSPSVHAEIGELTADLIEIKGPVAVNTIIPVSIRVMNREGKPVQDLEPYMGAFAHVVALHEDFATVLHLHPHGAVPKTGELGGPNIDINLKFPLPGYYRLFVQVQRQGQLVLLPFGVVAR